MSYKTGCLICGFELTYLAVEEELLCEFAIPNRECVGEESRLSGNRSPSKYSGACHVR